MKPGALLLLGKVTSVPPTAAAPSVRDSGRRPRPARGLPGAVGLTLPRIAGLDLRPELCLWCLWPAKRCPGHHDHLVVEQLPDGRLRERTLSTREVVEAVAERAARRRVVAALHEGV